MLNLSRRKGESVVLTFGEITIRVTYLGQKNPESNTIKLGIIAPESVKILREELVNVDKETRSE